MAISLVIIVADDQSKPLPRKSGPYSILIHTADFGQHTEITLQGVLNRDYTLRLFIENEGLELQTQDNRTWTPTQHLYVPCFLTIHNY